MSRPIEILRAATRAGVCVTVADGRRLEPKVAAAPPASNRRRAQAHAEEIIKRLSAGHRRPSRLRRTQTVPSMMMLTGKSVLLAWSLTATPRGAGPRRRRA
jgi:hypothetical protein